MEYHDANGDPITLFALVRAEPEWAQSRIERLTHERDSAVALALAGTSQQIGPFVPRKCGACGRYSDAPASPGCPPGAHMLAEMHALRIRAAELEKERETAGDRFDEIQAALLEHRTLECTKRQVYGDGECECGAVGVEKE